MDRLTKIGSVKPVHSTQVKESTLGLGFEKLDRAVFDPEKAYDKVAALGVKWIRIQSGWARTEKEPGVYDFAWFDDIVGNLLRRGLRPWVCLCYGNPLYDEEVVEHAAITEMAERVVSLGPLAGLAAYDIDNDYYDVERNYPLLSDAIQLLNPSK